VLPLLIILGPISAYFRLFQRLFFEAPRALPPPCGVFSKVFHLVSYLSWEVCWLHVSSLIYIRYIGAILGSKDPPQKNLIFRADQLTYLLFWDIIFFCAMVGIVLGCVSRTQNLLLYDVRVVLEGAPRATPPLFYFATHIGTVNACGVITFLTSKDFALFSN